MCSGDLRLPVKYVTVFVVFAAAKEQQLVAGHTSKCLQSLLSIHVCHKPHSQYTLNVAKI